MSNIVDKIDAYSQYQKWDLKNKKTLLAVSGGRDSMCLVHYFLHQSYSFEIAHVNYGLRGEESDAETRKLQNFSKKHNLKLHIHRVPNPQYIKSSSQGTQDIAREIRYEFFKTLIDNNGLDYIATAHHADDNVETLLMRLLDGAGLSGLGGIPPQNGRVIRPFIQLSQEDMESLVQLWDVQYSSDSSNLSDTYFRNRIRHKIIPILKSEFNNKYTNITHAIQHLQESKDLYEVSLHRKIRKLKSEKNGIDAFSISALSSIPAHDTLLYECMRPYGIDASQLPEVEKLLHSKSGKYLDTHSHRILNNRGQILIAPITKEQSKLYTLTDSTVSIVDNDFELRMKSSTKPSTAKKNKQYINLKKIQWPLTIRPWQKGDYFYPEGLAKKKKLSDFFVDLKLSLFEKDKVRVLQDPEGHIVSVLAYRIDHRYTAQEGQECLTISYKTL